MAARDCKRSASRWLAAALLLATARALDNGVATTPPLGWNPWNCFGIEADGSCKLPLPWRPASGARCHGFNETVVMAVARAFTASPLKRAGYQYVNLDCGWAMRKRGAAGELLVNLTAFPHGMVWLGERLHELGLKFGMYGSASLKQCCSKDYAEANDGSAGHEAQDAAQFASWGVDFLKYDACDATLSSYAAMRDALNRTGRPIVYSVHTVNMPSLLGDRSLANMWRTSSDVHSNYESIMTRAYFNDGYANVSGPGAWGDADMLEVGNLFGPLGDAEGRSHFSLWCLMKAPLIIGTDLTNATKATLETLSNTEAISVNQDRLGIPGRLRWRTDRAQVWTGVLEGGAVVVVMHNTMNASAEKITLTADALPPGVALASRWRVRDVWRGSTLNQTAPLPLTMSVEPHDVAMLILTPEGSSAEAPSAEASSAAGDARAAAPQTPRAPAREAAEEAPKPHVLMIAADDMRSEISPYGHNYMATPNLQSIADDGFTFRRAYVQVALCAPSRTALLTGRRPDTSRVWAIGPYFRNLTGHNWTTLPGFFKQRGFRSIGLGKIFHDGGASGWPRDQDEEYGSWSVPYYRPGPTSGPYSDRAPFANFGLYQNATAQCPTANDSRYHCVAPHSYLGVDAPWEEFIDAESATRAVRWIENASEYEDPMFLAVGFHRPHIPYVYPKTFEFTGDVAFPPANYHITQGIPPVALHDWTIEGMRYKDLATITPRINKGHETVQEYQANVSQLCDAAPIDVQAAAKRAYLSSIQFVDHLVGVLLTALKARKLYEQTTVVFWGDHGYKLGEHCGWYKHHNYENDVRIPLLLKPPSHVLEGAPRGRVVDELVEEIDIYPSLADMLGLTVPPELEGESWVPLLHGLGQDAAAEGRPTPGKAFVFSQYPHYDAAHSANAMGYSIRTPQWRYTVWLPFACDIIYPMAACANASRVAPRWDEPFGVELYDHSGDEANDFTKFENVNLAHVGGYARVVSDLQALLAANWPAPAAA